MPQVDFYIAKESSPQFALLTACRITEKAHKAGLRVHICTSSENDSHVLDTLLWTFRDQSFIPHEFLSSSLPICPITIGTEFGPVEAEMLINLSHKIPEKFERFQRIAEIIGHHPESIHAGRERYRFYREHGLEPQHHEVFSSH